MLTAGTPFWKTGGADPVNLVVLALNWNVSQRRSETRTRCFELLAGAHRTHQD
jgi:hypothetical protein